MSIRMVSNWQSFQRALKRETINLWRHLIMDLYVIFLFLVYVGRYRKMCVISYIIVVVSSLFLFFSFLITCVFTMKMFNWRLKLKFSECRGVLMAVRWIRIPFIFQLFLLLAVTVSVYTSVKFLFRFNEYYCVKIIGVMHSIFAKQHMHILVHYTCTFLFADHRSVYHSVYLKRK